MYKLFSEKVEKPEENETFKIIASAKAMGLDDYF